MAANNKYNNQHTPDEDLFEPGAVKSNGMFAAMLSNEYVPGEAGKAAVINRRGPKIAPLSQRQMLARQVKQRSNELIAARLLNEYGPGAAAVKEGPKIAPKLVPANVKKRGGTRKIRLRHARKTKKLKKRSV